MSGVTGKQSAPKACAGRLSKNFLLCLLVGLAGCTSLVIRDSQDPQGDKHIAANIPPLGTLLNESSDHAFIVLIHGVGFHCPSYGLDPDNGWLTKKTLDALQLHPTDPDAKLVPQFIPDTENRHDGTVDPNSGLYLLRRAYTYRPSNGKSTSVEIAEITWSGLTAWLKLKELGTDYSAAFPAGDGRVLQDGIPEAIACPGLANTTYPFSRQVLNALIKESTLDSALSDAVIYVGTYGPKIEIGTAEVLCRLVSSKTYTGVERCQWRDADATKLQSQFIFMSHSLGSRIIFDTLLDLDGHPTRETGRIFEHTLNDARPATEQIIANTRAVYMFANQLPILSLASTPVTETSDKPPAFLDLKHYHDLDSKRNSGRADSALSSDPAERAAPHLSWFAAVKSNLSSKDATKPVKLDIIAFSDPNDLLSYTIPPWFSQDMGTLQFQITNVKLRNDIHWFHLYESAPAAHGNYMVNSDVWDVIRCGARNGKVDCKETGAPAP